MTKYKCLIIDDDPTITDLVMHYADKCEDIEYCISCNDPVEGLKLLVNSRIDILFLDYNMPTLNGQDLLDLKRDDSKVIMITSNTEFAVDSYKYDDVKDYLVKPLDYDRFLKAVNRIREKSSSEEEVRNQKSDQKTIMVKDGINWVPVTYNDIHYIRSESNYCTFHTGSGKIMTLAKLKTLEDKLPDNFIRCHRSYIVNMSFAKSINLEEIKINENSIPVSAMYKERIKSYIDKNL